MNRWRLLAVFFAQNKKAVNKITACQL